jgi:hypothetical protein
MSENKHPGFEIKHFETSLQHIIDYFVKGFDKSPSRYKFFINPYDQKVLIELFVRKEQEFVKVHEDGLVSEIPVQRKDSQGVEQ